MLYPDFGKYPYPLFNERVNCRLGENLYESGKLSARAISRTLRALQRFSLIIKNMDVKHIVPVATAAVINSENNN